MELEEENKHFFKVLIPGFHDKLNLPPSFCKKLKQEKSEWANLTSRKGTFKIEVCRNGEDVISFEDGWPKFVESHSLSIGDFLVFEHVGRLNFNVSVFDPSGCENEFLNECNGAAVNLSCPKKNKRGSRGREKKCTVASYNMKIPYFIAIMRPCHEKYLEMVIPIEFVRLNNLQEKSGATLRNGRGRSWPVTLCARKTPNFRLCIRGGWRVFYVSNKLKVGDALFFYLKPSPARSTTVIFDVKIRRPV